MRLTYSAYAPPAPKKKKKFARARFRGRTPAAPAASQTAATQTPGTTGAAAATSAGTTTAAGATSTAAATATTPAKPAATQQASNNDQNVQKPGKKEKIRFGQAPRESLPSSQVATNSVPAVGPDTNPAVTTPESRVVNPDGTIAARRLR